MAQPLVIGLHAAFDIGCLSLQSISMIESRRLKPPVMSLSPGPQLQTILTSDWRLCCLPTPVTRSTPRPLELVGMDGWMENEQKDSQDR